MAKGAIIGECDDEDDSAFGEGMEDMTVDDDDRAPLNDSSEKFDQIGPPKKVNHSASAHNMCSSALAVLWQRFPTVRLKNVLQ